MGPIMHFVDFSLCKHCESRDKPEWESPCYDCLQVSARIDGSRKPINFKEREETKKRS